LLDFLRLVVALVFEGFRSGCIDPPHFEMASEVDGIEGAVSLALEGFDVAVEVHDAVVPGAFLEAAAGSLDEEGFDFCFICSG
jgi:hypothetical protein